MRILGDRMEYFVGNWKAFRVSSVHRIACGSSEFLSTGTRRAAGVRWMSISGEQTWGLGL
jgi:hypothetical protein